MAEYITRPNTGVIRGSKLGIPPDIDELLKDKAEKETVQKMNTDINARIDSTNKNMDVVSKSLGATQTKVTEHSELLIPLQEQVSESIESVSNITERTEALEITTQAHTDSINELSVRVDGIGEGGTGGDSPDLSQPLLEVTNKVNELEPKVNNHVTQIASLQSSVKDIPTIKTDVNNAKSRLSSLENNDIIGFKMKPYEIRKQGTEWDLRADYVNGGGTIAVFEDGKRLRLTFTEPFTTRPIGLVSQDYSGVSAQYDVKIGNCQLGYADVTFFNKSNQQVNIADIGTPLYVAVMFVGV